MIEILREKYSFHIESHTHIKVRYEKIDLYSMILNYPCVCSPVPRVFSCYLHFKNIYFFLFLSLLYKGIARDLTIYIDLLPIIMSGSGYYACYSLGSL